MTVSSSYQPKSYKPGSAMAAEALGWPLLSAGNLSVVHVSATTGVRTPKTLGNDYEVTGNLRGGGGSIRALASYPALDDWIVTRVTPSFQEADLQAHEALPAEDVELELDRRAMVEQEIAAGLVDLGGRALQVPVGALAPAVDLTGLIEGDLFQYRGGSLRRFEREAFAGKMYGGGATGEPIPVTGNGGADAALRVDLADDFGSLLVGDKADGPGAVKRSLRVNLRDFAISPRSYLGALDGITDDTNAVKFAIDAAVQRPGAVVELGGRTAYCGAIQLPTCANLTIRDGSITVKGDVTWLSAVAAAGLITYLKLENLFIDASEHNAAVGRALINWSKCAYSTFRNIRIYNPNGGKTIGFYAAGDGVHGPYYNLFEMLYGGGLLYGIQLAPAATVAETVNNNTVRAIRFNPGGAGRYAVYIGTNNQQNRVHDAVGEDTIAGSFIYDDGIGTLITGTRNENLDVGVESGPNARGGTDFATYFDSNTLQYYFPNTASEESHNSLCAMDGAGNPLENKLAGGLRIGGGLRLRGNPGFPGGLLLGQGFAYASGTLGHALGGNGSANDVTLLNRSGVTVARIPTNSTEFVHEGMMRLKGFTVGTLPAAGTAGRAAYVTDATAPTYLGPLIGGGAVVTTVSDNGSAWVAA